MPPKPNRRADYQLLPMMIAIMDTETVVEALPVDTVIIVLF